MFCFFNLVVLINLKLFILCLCYLFFSLAFVLCMKLLYFYFSFESSAVMVCLRWRNGHLRWWPSVACGASLSFAAVPVCIYWLHCYSFWTAYTAIFIVMMMCMILFVRWLLYKLYLLCVTWSLRPAWLVHTVLFLNHLNKNVIIFFNMDSDVCLLSSLFIYIWWCRTFLKDILWSKRIGFHLALPPQVVFIIHYALCKVMHSNQLNWLNWEM